MASIFLSYRRGRGASEAAGRLHDRLASRFGSDAVFMDVDTVRPGADFVQTIGEAIDPRGAVLAIIDPGWAVDTSGRNRISEPGDYVRLEIATALQRGATVIPVLVLGAQMPPPDQLPPDLLALARRQAVVISHERFSTDVLPLERELEALLTNPAVQTKPSRSSSKQQGQNPPGKGKGLRRIVLIGFLVAAVTLVVANWPEPTPQPGSLVLDDWYQTDLGVAVSVSNPGDEPASGVVLCDGVDPTGPFTLRVPFDHVPPGGASSAWGDVFAGAEAHDCWVE